MAPVRGAAKGEQHMSRMSRESTHAWVGAGVVVAVLAFAGFINADDPTATAANSFRLEGRFTATDGVTIGSQVVLVGIPVGKVVGQSYEADMQSALLTMAIDGGINIPEDSVAMIVSNGVFGEKYIKVTPGGALDMLEDGDEFEFVQDSVVFEELLEKVILGAEAKRMRAREEAEQNGATEETN